MGHAILERVLLFGTRSADYIRASGHNGCIATEVTLQATTEAEYMTAPERFADSQIPLAPRAPSIHDPSSTPKNNLSLDYVVFVRILVSVEEPTNDHARAAVTGN